MQTNRFYHFNCVLKFENFKICKNCSYKQRITSYVKSYFFSCSFTLNKSLSKYIMKIETI